MRRKSIRVTVFAAVFLTVLVALALASQDKYTVKVPNGLAFSEFRGYEDWQTIAVSQTEAVKVLRAILGNPVMMKAVREGIPGNGKPFPDGSRIAKILWKQKTITDHAPFSVSAPDTVPDVLQAVELMVKDTKRFPDTHGWGYGEFVYDAATGTFKPLGEGAKCGAACHDAAAKRDYVFTEYSFDETGRERKARNLSDYHALVGEYLCAASSHWGCSGFANTDLELQLKKHGIRKLIITGLMAHTCVEATVRDAVELGYEVTVVKDANRRFDLVTLSTLGDRRQTAPS